MLCKKLFDDICKESGKEAGFKYKVCDFADMYQDAFSVAKIALVHIKEAKDSAKNVSPIYLRASQAERERLEKEAEQKGL